MLFAMRCVATCCDAHGAIGAWIPGTISGGIPSRLGVAGASVSFVMPDNPNDAATCGQVHYVNFPEDAKEVRSTLADNARWANSVRQRLRVARLHYACSCCARSLLSIWLLPRATLRCV